MGLLDFLFSSNNASAKTGNSANAGQPIGGTASIKPPQNTRKAKPDSINATQVHLKIGEIRDNVLVLKNGGLRAILRATSVNFNLKSEDEQNSITYGYQGFLNSLEFPVQIVVRSKKLDIDDYIDNIKRIGEKQENPLLKEQTMEYADFVKKLVEYTDIMQKEFYVIVPFDPLRSKDLPFVQKFLQRLQPRDNYMEIKKRHQEFDQLKKNLLQRINVVEAGLGRCSIQTKQLTTSEIIELFYNVYNPQIARTEKLKHLDKLTIASDEEVLEIEKDIENQEPEKTPEVPEVSESIESTEMHKTTESPEIPETSNPPEIAKENFETSTEALKEAS